MRAANEIRRKALELGILPKRKRTLAGTFDPCE
jgi:hypothetical protein